MIGRMYDREFIEENNGDKMSINDHKFLVAVSKGIKQMNDGHYEVPLPLKPDTDLPESKEMATKRLMGIKQKMARDSQYKSDYMKGMNKMINQGHAERAPGRCPAGSGFYIPHHGVYHPRKRDKLRIVFNCSAEVGGKSLNGSLLPGPDLTNNLTGVLCRFRRENVTVV